MDTSHKPLVTATPQELARIHRHLIAAFCMNFVLTVMGYVLPKIQTTDPFVLSIAAVLILASLVASIYLCVTLYAAATRLGFRKLTVILAIILAFFIDVLGLILIVSADIRLSKELKAKGWKVGLFGARPA